MRPMNVAVVDVGSNTIRLLVGTRADGRIVEVATGRRVVGLGADVERFGAISVPKLAESVECVAGFVDEARRAGAGLIDVVVASPGRQARNSAQLIHLLSRATELEARVLTREDEARLAFEGALVGAARSGAVAVCDVGGGSAQVAVGTVEHGPAWLRSIDLGSLRLSARIPHSDPPGKKELAVLRLEARAAVTALTPPLPGGAVAVGGTARSLRKLVGPSLGPDELREAFDLLRRTPAAELAARYGIDRWRAPALPAGAAIVTALQGLLGVPLEVGRGGLREGVLLELLGRLALPAVQAGGR
jgi:exopolyphosphatase / guanosine-5'-triphosphate,3'-diphosphate pyrophosphatase